MFIIITTMAAPVEEHAKHPHSPYLFVSPKTGTMFDPDSFRHTHEKILKAIGSVISQTMWPTKTAGEGRMMPSVPLRCFPDLSAFGSRFGSCEKRQNAASLFENINAKKFLISYEIRNFLVETAGLEPVTSCV